MKRAARIFLVIGLGIASVLILQAGADNIIVLLSRAGLKMLWLVPLQVFPLTLDVCGWRSLIADRVKTFVLFGIAAVRQAINRLLPVANIGGDIVGIRLLTQQGVQSTEATASVILDLLLGLVAQFLFVALGVACLSASVADARPTRALVIGLLATLPFMILLGLALRRGRIVARMTRLSRRLFASWLDEQHRMNNEDRLELAIQAILSARSRTLQSIGWQLLGYLAGCLETWLALRWLGAPIDVKDAVILESLMQGAKSIFFLIPAGVGVQEAGLVGVGHLLGLPADATLALSLAKRMREILFGVPALIGWQLNETRKAISAQR